ncbi:MAG: amylo-alpha-1,6-glucosidase [Planctomycetaceae bacterium]
MTNVLRRLRFDPHDGIDHERLLTREWLVTNGLGGYSSGTIAGVPTRRYHGLLISALAAPLGRMLLLAHVAERVRLPDGRTVDLGGEERGDESLSVHGADHLREFRLENGLPVWRFDVGGVELEKRILMPHEQNTVHVTYRLLSGDGPVRLKLLPAIHYRSHDASVDTPLPNEFQLRVYGDRYEVTPDEHRAPLRLKILGQRCAFTFERRTLPELLFRIERRRGYQSRGQLWSPGYFRVDLEDGHEASLVASTESWNVIESLPPEAALAVEHERRRRLIRMADSQGDGGMGDELVLAADQFLIQPAGRTSDAAWAHAAGDEARTVIAGYHWFTDWGRDTMISLEGLTLCTGRKSEAGYLLRTFAHYVRDGLIPNMFPEGECEGLYHTADATLWFFHALDRYVAATSDRDTLRTLLPKMVDIARQHLAGTRFQIGVDPADGLLRQGEEGYQLTWMDAKVGDWVVTPRRGKAVEINALWHNALKLLEGWLREYPEAGSADEFAQHAERTRDSFNERFWYDDGGYLYDLVDGPEGDDPACRPNQIFALSLAHPVLDEPRWRPVVEAVRERLLTPMGLRSLAPGHPDYKPIYTGDLRARDAAYHQGTVWAWLIGPFIDAWLNVYPDRRRIAREFLEGFDDHLGEACIGSISEIFDADAPYTPRGCCAQAWSVAEVLRCWIKTAEPPVEDPKPPVAAAS